MNFNEEIKDKDPKFKVGDNVRISKYKNTFAKGYNVTNDLNGEKMVGTFNENELQNANQNEFRIEKSNEEKR